MLLLYLVWINSSLLRQVCLILPTAVLIPDAEKAWNRVTGLRLFCSSVAGQVYHRYLSRLEPFLFSKVSKGSALRPHARTSARYSSVDRSLAYPKPSAAIKAA